MRNVMVCFLAVSVVVAFSSAGCSHRSKKRGKESLKITTTTLPDATEGVAYSCTVTASGGNSANYSWSVSGQPSWLSIDATTGELSGTPPTGSAGNTYTFTVEVTDGQQTASEQFDLEVNPLLKADFDANPTSGTVPLTVNFTDKSTGNPTSWQWDFDNDGTVDSNDQNPTYTYNSPGWYTVKLTVSNGTNSDACVKEMLILVANKIYYVDGVGGDDANGGTGWSYAFATIGKALSAAGDYDLVLVADATYNETNLNFNGKKIYLKGVDHNTVGQHPVIDCQGGDRAFYFDSGETKDSVVDNFTIKNGNADYGGAIYCNPNSSPTLNNCILWSNSASSSGNEVYAGSGCTVTLNYCCVDSTGCGGSGTIDDSNNCIHDDPQFVDAANGDFHLKGTSPCIDAGDNSLVPSGVDKDLDGNQRIVDGNNDGTATVDIGAYEKQ